MPKVQFDNLEIGAGERYTEGFARQDIDPNLPDLDLVCPAEKLDQYVEKVKKLRATHVIEHFPTKEVVKVLRTWFNCLVPGGELYLEVPNFAWHAQLVMEGREEEAVYYAFGGQLDQWDFHQTGLTPRILKDRLEEAGYVDIKILGHDTMLAFAYKPYDIGLKQSNNDQLKDWL